MVGAVRAHWRELQLGPEIGLMFWKTVVVSVKRPGHHSGWQPGCL